MCLYHHGASTIPDLFFLLSRQSQKQRISHSEFVVDNDVNLNSIRFNRLYTFLFKVNGTIAVINSDEVLQINQTYYSTAKNEVILKSKFGKTDRVDCKWTTARRANNQTNFKRDWPNWFGKISNDIIIELCYPFSHVVCRDEEATATAGTITPTGISKISPGRCTFLIKAPSDQQIQITCSSSNISNSISNYLTVSLFLQLPRSMSSLFIFASFINYVCVVLDWWINRAE